MNIEPTLERVAFDRLDDHRTARSMAGLQRAQTLVRYSLPERVRAGGMGVVWSTYSPKLHRRMAIGLLRPRPSSSAPAQIAPTRSLLEAQAMARLSRPDVIAVHDVGDPVGQQFGVMKCAYPCRLIACAIPETTRSTPALRAWTWASSGAGPRIHGGR